jgi:transposase
MRGKTTQQLPILLAVSVDHFVPQGHPLRGVRRLALEAMKELEPIFDSAYSRVGRASIPPEQLLLTLLLQALYGVRSERQICEQLQYNLLYRWFVGLELTDVAFDASTFSKNRKRFLADAVCDRFLQAVVGLARKKGLLGDDSFSVDGTIIEASASHKSLVPKPTDEDDDHDNDDGDAGRPAHEADDGSEVCVADTSQSDGAQASDDARFSGRETRRRDGNGWSSFKGEHRSNRTHVSKTDPEARLVRKSHCHPAVLGFAVNSLMDNRHRLIVGVRADIATGTIERDAALDLLREHAPGSHRIRLAADKAYDTKDFVGKCRALGITPNVARNTGRGRRRSNIDGRTTRHDGYRASQRARKQIEQIYAWLKAPGRLRKTFLRGVERVDAQMKLAVSGFNLLRISRLIGVAMA